MLEWQPRSQLADSLLVTSGHKKLRWARLIIFFFLAFQLPAVINGRVLFTSGARSPRSWRAISWDAVVGFDKRRLIAVQTAH